MTPNNAIILSVIMIICCLILKINALLVLNQLKNTKIFPIKKTIILSFYGFLNLFMDKKKDEELTVAILGALCLG